MRMIWVALICAMVLSAGPGWAYQDQDRARDAVRSGDIMSLSQIKSRASRMFGGQFLDAQLYPRHGVPSVYEVKMLDRDGNVFIVRMDARTGHVIGVRGRR